MPEETCSHVPDMDTVRIKHENGGIYLDVSCELCGQSGCIAEVFYNEDQEQITALGDQDNLFEIDLDTVFDKQSGEEAKISS